MSGVARALFVPLSMAVAFSMIASYLVASTFVPVLSIWLIRPPRKDTTENRRLSFARWIGRLALLWRTQNPRRSAQHSFYHGG